MRGRTTILGLSLLVLAGSVTGSAAIAKVVLEYPQATLTDYFALLKIDGKWQIVNKIFHSEPRK